MGRKKLEIKRIQDKSNRQVAALIFSKSGKLYQFSHSNSVAATLQQYRDVSDADQKEATGIHESKNSKYASNQAKGDLLQRVERDLAELNPDQLTVENLMQLETELETALVQTRAAIVSVNTQLMMEPITTLQEKEKSLREENDLLMQQIAEVVQENIAAKEKGGPPAVHTHKCTYVTTPFQQTKGTMEEERKKLHKLAHVNF
ncbi:hypothetical protein POM88_028367 [Heracleum sosnowskyi]|uniref:MADS-box domain-containing protein n=1 Tax=Heracleum sosnowskyi TaxID=360622 RepID=A0AAD8IAH1_9APIA|nr:hypothetical protein POM88_028367 [Heracleum sosnowskyi]